MHPSPTPTCPDCRVPMLLEDAETTPLGVRKTVFRCAICRTETDQLSKAGDPPKEAAN